MSIIGPAGLRQPKTQTKALKADGRAFLDFVEQGPVA